MMRLLGPQCARIRIGWGELRHELSVWRSDRLLSSHTGNRDDSSDENDQLRTAMKHCVDLVRENDYENYAWSSLLQKNQKIPVIALRALNIELGRIAEHAKTEMLIMMRFQWWREAIVRAFSGNESYEMQQPTMRIISEVIRHRNLSKYRVLRMLGAMEEDALRTRPLQTIGDLEQYAESTFSQLLYLQLESCGFANSSAEHTASHLGKAVGIASMLRSAPLLLQRNKTYFPQELLDEAGVTSEDFKNSDGEFLLPDVVFRIASVAKAHLDAARKHGNDVPAPARALFMPSLATELYLDALQKSSFDIFSTSLRHGGYSPISYLLRMRYRIWRETF